jgi:hypothetical protein
MKANGDTERKRSARFQSTRFEEYSINVPGYRCRDCAAHVGIDDGGPAAVEFARSSAETHVATGHTVVLVDDAGAHLLTPADLDDSDGFPADDREEVR